LTKITGGLHEDVRTLTGVVRRLVLLTSNVTDKAVDKIRAHILRSMTFI